MSVGWTRRIFYTEVRFARPAPSGHATSAGSGPAALHGYVGWRHRVRSVLRSPRLRRATLGGAVGGLLGAMAVLLSLAGMPGAEGSDGWLATKLFGAPFLADAALQPGYDGAGVLTSLAVAGILGSVLGAAFGAAANRLHEGLVVPAGALYGLVLWGLTRALLWPSLSSSWHVALSGLLPGWGAPLLFLLYGAAVGVGVMIAVLSSEPRTIKVRAS